MSVHIHVQNVEYNFSGLRTFRDRRGNDSFVVISLFELKESSRGVEKVAFSQSGITLVVATVLPGSARSFHGLRHVQVELGVDLSRGVVDGGAQLPVEGPIVEDGDELVLIEQGVCTGLCHEFLDPVHHCAELVKA